MNEELTNEVYRQRLKYVRSCPKDKSLINHLLENLVDKDKELVIKDKEIEQLKIKVKTLIFYGD